MNLPLSPALIRVRFFATLVGLYAFLGGLFSIMGWATDQPALTDWFRGGISIQPNTTLASAAAGAAVIALTWYRTRLAAFLGVVVACFGVTVLFQDITGISLGIDTLFIFGRQWGQTGTTSIGRMGLPAALSWTMLGVGIVSAAVRPGGRSVTIPLAMLTLVLAAFSLLGYLYGADLLYSLPRYTAISLQTSTIIIAVSLGLIASQVHRQPMRTLVEQSAAGLLLRRALPVVLVLPIALGVIRTWGEQAGWFDAGMGRSLLIIALILIMVGGLWWIAGGVARHEQALVDSEGRQAVLAEVGYLMRGGQEPVIALSAVSRRVAQHFGVSRCGYTRINLKAETVVVEHDYHEGSRVSLAGTYPLAGYADFYRREAEAGEVVFISDLRADRRTRAAFDDLFAPIGVRSFIVIPLLRDGVWVANFWLAHHEPREWDRDTVNLMRTLAERVKVAIENMDYVQDLKRADVRLLQAARMEALGRLAGGLAHDFNNQLQAVSGFASFIQGDPKVGDKSREDLEEIQKAVEKIASLIRQLLAFSRQQVLQPEVVELGAAVQDNLPLLRQFLGPAIELTLETAPETVWIRVDRAQLHQVLINLTINARDAMPGGGRLLIAVTRCVVDSMKVPWPDATPGEYGCLTVTDTGAGITDTDLPFIFEPFFTTKAVGEGTGLGLATVHGIVTQSRGSIQVDTEPGHGTRFTILLPVTERPEPLPVPDAPAPRRSQHNSRVMVVDDEPMVRNIVKRILEQQGYRVVEAVDGRDALARLEREDGVDLVLSDILMPNVGGAELGEILALKYPELPIVWMSGFPREIAFRDGRGGHQQPFLQKPVKLEELLRVVAAETSDK